MNRINIIFALLIAMLLPTCFEANGATKTAKQVMSELTTRLNGNGSVSASYSISGSSSARGTVICSGKKFKITGTANVWYDGKTMWSLNPRTKEMTVSSPSAEEVAQSNPLMLIAGWANLFTAEFPKNAKNTNTIILTSRSKKSGMKGAVLTLAKGIPAKLVITSQNGSKTTVTISNFKIGKSVAASTFSGQTAAGQKGITVVDLR